MEIVGSEKKSYFDRIAAMMAMRAAMTGTPMKHGVRGFKASSRYGFERVAGMSKLARRKLRTGR